MIAKGSNPSPADFTYAFGSIIPDWNAMDEISMHNVTVSAGGWHRAGASEGTARAGRDRIGRGSAVNNCLENVTDSNPCCLMPLVRARFAA